MANINITSDAWTEISITSGTVQNISATADIELSAEQVDNSGVVLKPSEIYQWDNETIYARAVTEATGALRVVNFKKAAGGGGSYVLPVASSSTLGGVKIGSNISIDADGVISTHAPYSLPTAAVGTLGGVKVGSGLSINGSGVLSSTSGATVNYSTTEQQVGTWIDGKPLYQITVNKEFTETVVDNVDYQIAFVNDSIDYAIITSIVINKISYPIFSVANAFLRKSTGYLITKFQHTSINPINSICITLQYTKTTD